MVLQCGLLQALKIKRANNGHSHQRNRNRNELGQQVALLQALLQVLCLLMLSTRMLVLDGRGWGALPLSLKHRGMNCCCSDQLLKDPTPNPCTRMLPRMLQFYSSSTQERQFREHMGPNFSLSLLAGDGAWWGQGQSEVGSTQGHVVSLLERAEQSWHRDSQCTEQCLYAAGRNCE